MEITNSILITTQEDLVRYWLVVTPDSVKVDKDGQLSDEYISCQVIKQEGEKSPSATSDLAVKYQKSDGVLTTYTSAVQVTSSLDWVKFFLYQNDQVIDNKTVLVQKDGENGDIGPSGASPRQRFWTEGEEFLQGAEGEKYYDMVLNEENDAFYLCTKSHTSSVENKPPNTTYWIQSYNNPFLTAKTLAAQRIAADQIETNNLVVKHLQTNTTGPRIVASGTMMEVYGIFEHPNIRLGVNSNGMAVLIYYDNTGRALYNLGPEGIQKIRVEDDTWSTMRLIYAGESEPNLFSIYWSTVCNPLYTDGTTYYQFHSRRDMSGQVVDPLRDNHIYASNDTASLMAVDGYYIECLGKGVPSGPSNARLKYISLEIGQPAPDVHDHNPRLNWSETVFMTNIMQIRGGAIFNSFFAYYNLIYK